MTPRMRRPESLPSDAELRAIAKQAFLEALAELEPRIPDCFVRPAAAQDEPRMVPWRGICEAAGTTPIEQPLYVDWEHDAGEKPYIDPSMGQ